MALDRQGTAWAILRVSIGVFFLFEGIGKLGWLTNSAILADIFRSWSGAAAPGSISQWYLQRVAEPGVSTFARLVPLGELSAGIALILGIWTRVFALVAFFMALNYQIASGAIFKYAFLTSGYGLPVLSSTLALTIGGSRQPWSVRSGKSSKV